MNPHKRNLGQQEKDLQANCTVPVNIAKLVSAGEVAFRSRWCSSGFDRVSCTPW